MGWNIAKITAIAVSLPLMAFAQMGGNWGFGVDQNNNYSEKISDVNYANDGKKYHNLDIYIPKETKDSYPVVIHTYGSAWSMNDQKGQDLGTICAGFLKAGFAVVTPNHRSASDAIYPAQLHDLKAVVRFIRGNAAKYKFDTNFVAMSGFSSGGHLSSLTATTCGMKEGTSGSVTVDLEGSLGEYTQFSSCIDAACLWSPPTDIYTMNPIRMGGSGTLEGAFIGAEREGNKDKWMVASSPYYVDENDPPIILFHGTSDAVVNIEQSQEMYDSLQKHNVVSEYVKVPNGSHGGSEMYSSENLGKAVAFFNKAIESKAAATPPATDTSKIDSIPATDTSAVKPDTTNTDTTKIADTTNTDTTNTADITNVDTTATYLVSSAKAPIKLSIVGNKIYVGGSMARMKYKVVSVSGSFTETGDVMGSLDLSRLKVGVYCVIVTATNGTRGMVKFVKK